MTSQVASPEADIQTGLPRTREVAVDLSAALTSDLRKHLLSGARLGARRAEFLARISKQHARCQLTL